MANAKLVKPNVIRGKIFDKLAETFGDSVLGMYENKLRVEVIDEETGEVIQFSLAPVIHKTLVEEEECDQLVPIAEQIAAYDAAKAAKDADAAAKKAKTAEGKGKGKGKAKDGAEGDVPTPVAPAAPVELSAEDQAKLNDLSAMLNTEGF